MGKIAMCYRAITFRVAPPLVDMPSAKRKSLQRSIDNSVGMGCKESENTSLNPDQCVWNIYSPNTKCPKFAPKSKKIIKPFRLSMVG